jgi:hypothetical protein
MKKGRAGTMTHDHKRHGTTTLFAALDVASGKVIGECMNRHLKAIAQQSSGASGIPALLAHNRPRHAQGARSASHLR